MTRGANRAAALARPTVLVGYGAFGLDVLERLLLHAALRGVLRWREPRGGAGAGERHLDELALIWVPEDEDLAGRRRREASTEVLRDLYREIEELRRTSVFETDVVDAVDRAAHRVLSAASRADRTTAAPLELDLVLVAHPRAPQEVGTLDRLTTAALDHLANYVNLTSDVQGSDRLVCLEILDFDNYWDRGEEARRLRRAVRQSVEAWQHKRNLRRPSPSRVYLVDGASTREGLRGVEHRLEEVALFLELLLFDHPREASDPLQRLGRSAGAHESPLGTFGIRLFERSAGLLSRLAAARFGIGWLDYLAEGSPDQPTPEARHLRELLSPYEPDQLDALLDTAGLRRELEQDLAQLESRLMELDPAVPSWLDQVRETYERAAMELRERVREAASERMAALYGERLASLGDDLRAAVDADLRDGSEPVPISSVLASLERAMDELGELVGPEQSESDDVDGALGELEKIHGRYRQFDDQRVDLTGLRTWWWPMLALAIAVGFASPASEIAAELASRWPALTNPLTVGCAIFFFSWWVGVAGAHPLLEARSRRARRFFDDADRGRFVDRLRAGLGPGGEMRAPIMDHLDGLLLEMRWGVRSEVRRHLQRVRDRLAQRRREMVWLRGELREFLSLYGVALQAPLHELQLSRNGTGVRHAVERGEDLAAVLAQNPPDPQRYRSLQADPELNPFADWHEDNAPFFLNPLAFVDRLCHGYADPFALELARPGTGPEQAARERDLIEFFERNGRFDPAFGWKKQDGVPPGQRLALLPARWRRLPGVLPRLSELGVVGENVLTGADEERAYLLRVDLGIGTECLEEAR